MVEKKTKFEEDKKHRKRHVLSQTLIKKKTKEAFKCMVRKNKNMSKSINIQNEYEMPANLKTYQLLEYQTCRERRRLSLKI